MTSWYIVPLPKSKWHSCPSCGGTGQIEEIRDMHRSGGIAPCGNCGGGIVRQEVISGEEYKHRNKGIANAE